MDSEHREVEIDNLSAQFSYRIEYNQEKNKLVVFTIFFIIVIFQFKKMVYKIKEKVDFYQMNVHVCVVIYFIASSLFVCLCVCAGVFLFISNI